MHDKEVAPCPSGPASNVAHSFPTVIEPPRACPVCEDERQFVNWSGQSWLAREDFAQRYKLVWRDDLGMSSASRSSRPSQSGSARCCLREADGCVMWDCIPLMTDEAVAHLRSLGGLKAIAVSHPHYYGAVADWSEAFGNAPVYLHGDDRAFVTRPHPAIVPWSGETLKLSDDLTLLRTGGHFAGATVLHSKEPRGRQGRAACRRHRDGGDGSPPCQLHVQLSELHSARRRRRPAHRRCDRSARLRSHLRRLVGP